MLSEIIHSHKNKCILHAGTHTLCLSCRRSEEDIIKREGAGGMGLKVGKDEGGTRDHVGRVNITKVDCMHVLKGKLHMW